MHGTGYIEDRHGVHGMYVTHSARPVTESVLTRVERVGRFEVNMKRFAVSDGNNSSSATLRHIHTVQG